MIEIKVQFGDSLETILSASTTNVFSVLTLSEQSIALRAPAVHGVSSIHLSELVVFSEKLQPLFQGDWL